MKETICGLILAGGRGQRMNHADKGLVLYKEQALITYALQALNQVINTIIINANRNIEQYQQFGFPVISDLQPDFAGPLAGILSAMTQYTYSAFLVLPCDTPLIQAEHIKRLIQTYEQTHAEVVIAFDGQHLQPTFVLIQTQVKPQLADYLAQGKRKLADFLTQCHYVTVDFSDYPLLFTNLNTFDELTQLTNAHAS